MVKVSAQLRDFDKWKKSLRELEKKVARSGNRKAVNRSTNPMLKASRAKAPVRSGLLRKSLGKRVRTYVGSGTVVGLVGPRSKFEGTFDGKKVKPVNYAKFVEFGNSRMAARPFLRPAFDSSKSESQKVYEANIGRFIDIEAKRLGRRFRG